MEYQRLVDYAVGLFAAEDFAVEVAAVYLGFVFVDTFAGIVFLNATAGGSIITLYGESQFRADRKSVV